MNDMMAVVLIWGSTQGHKYDEVFELSQAINLHNTEGVSWTFLRASAMTILQQQEVRFHAWPSS